jgi:hypothetical protein
MLDEVNNYQKAFLQCMLTLEPWDLKRVCRAHSITPDELTHYVCADPVRRSKWEEVSQTVSIEMEKRTQK